MRALTPLLVVAVLLSAGCSAPKKQDPNLPAVTPGIPKFTDPPEWNSPSPTPSATPSDAELVRQTQTNYQAAFEEYEHLARLGNVSSASPRLKELASGAYLEKVNSGLAEQVRDGYTIEGKPSTTRSRPAPGKSSDKSDPALTLQVCEDRRPVTLVERDGTRAPSPLAQGHVYAMTVNGRVVLVDIKTEAVSTCDW